MRYGMEDARAGIVSVAQAGETTECGALACEKMVCLSHGRQGIIVRNGNETSEGRGVSQGGARA